MRRRRYPTETITAPSLHHRWTITVAITAPSLLPSLLPSPYRHRMSQAAIVGMQHSLSLYLASQLSEATPPPARHCHCTVTAPSLYNHCTITTPSLCGSCTLPRAPLRVATLRKQMEMVPHKVVMQQQRAPTAPSLYHHCIITASSLHHHCIVTVPSLHHPCASRAAGKGAWLESAGRDGGKSRQDSWNISLYLTRIPGLSV